MMKYSEFWELQDACSAELDEFAKRYEDARAKEKTAENANWAEVETAKAHLNFLIANAVYTDFLNNTVAEP